MSAVLKRKPAAPVPYEVGYGRPPVQSRFRPGQSGNPRGRPRGSRNRRTIPGLREEKLKTLILEEAYRPITVSDPAGRVTIPMAQAVLRSVAVNAAKGSHRAQRHFTELLAATERDKKREMDELLQTAIEYKRSWEEGIAYCKKHGLPDPDPVPHPDDVVVDLRTGTVFFRGPVTKEDRAELDRVRQGIRDSLSELAFLRSELEKQPGDQRCIEDIEYEEYMLALQRFTEQVLTGADAAELPRPVRPLSVQENMAKHKHRLNDIRKRGLLRPVLVSSRE